MKRSCKIKPCSKPKLARGWCSQHYYKWLRRGDPEAPTIRQKRGSQCSVKGCSKQVAARGWCATHYKRWKIHGNVAVCLNPHKFKVQSVPRGFWTNNYGFNAKEALNSPTYYKSNFGAFLYRSWKYASQRVRGQGPRHCQQYYKFSPLMTLIEWFEAYFNDSALRDLYRTWQLSGFLRKYTPVPDHDTDSGKGYVVGNIEWVTQSENSKRAREKDIA